MNLFTQGGLRKRISILADFPWTYFDAGAVGRGGGQGATWLAQLAEEFSKSPEFDIHWITLDRGGLSAPEVKHANGQTFHKIPAIKLSVDLLTGYHSSRRRLEGALRQIRPNLIHCWGSERAYATVCRDAGVPTVFSIQGILQNLYEQGLLPPIWQWRAICKWEPRFLRAATVVTCESTWGCSVVKRLCAEADVRQVEYGVHPSFFEVPWEPDTEDPYILFVGTLLEAKGVDTLVEAVSRIADRRWRLRVAGEGPLRERLEARRVPGVEWLGLVKWDKLKEELSKATCLVLPTLADTSPNVVKEARVVGLPVITSPHGGQVDYVRDHENGFIVDPRDPDQLAGAISRLMDSPGLAVKMGSCRLDENRRYLHPARTAEGFLRIYRELLARGQN